MNMYKVYPKIGESLAGLDSVKKYINEGIEIQLLKEVVDLHSITNKLMKECNQLKEITFHICFPLVELSMHLLSRRYLENMMRMVTECVEVYKSKGIKIKLIVPCV